MHNKCRLYALSMIARLPLCVQLRTMIRMRYLDLVYTERSSCVMRVLRMASLVCENFLNPIVLFCETSNEYVHTTYPVQYPVDGWSRRVFRVLRAVPIHERTLTTNRKLSQHVSPPYREVSTLPRHNPDHPL